MINFQIYYSGDDPEILKSGKEFYKKKSTASITYHFEACLPLPVFSFGNLIGNNNCSLILIDFTYPSLISHSIISQVNFLKQHHSYRHIVIAGLFKDKKSLERCWYLKHFGFNYFYIKGNELSVLFEDTFYISFDEDPGFSAFAKAVHLDLLYKASSPALITGVSEEGLKINTDIEIDYPEIELCHRFLGEQRSDHFPVVEKRSNCEIGDLLSSYTLSIPYPGPWEAANPDAIQKDTVETLLSEEDIFTAPHQHCLICSQDDQLFLELFRVNFSIPIEVHFEKKDPLEKITSLRPQLLVLAGTETEDFQKQSEEIIAYLNTLTDYSPMIVLFKNEDSSEAARKRFDYEKLLSLKTSCDLKTLEKLLEAHVKKFKTSDEEWKAIGPLDERASAEVLFELKVTGISEHEITFICQHEIPMYSNLEFDVPVKCHILVVPPLKEKGQIIKKNHYTGIIHGIDQKEATYLRKFVNQIIFKPLKKFEIIILNTNEKETPEPVSIQKTESKRIEEAAPSSRRRFFKNSKL